MKDLEKLSVLSKHVYGFLINEQISLITMDRSIFIQTTFKDDILKLSGYNIDNIKSVLTKMSMLKNIDNISILSNKKGFNVIDGNNIIKIAFSNIEMFNHTDGSEKGILISDIIKSIDNIESDITFKLTSQQVNDIFLAMKTFDIKEEIFLNINNKNVYFEFFSKNATSSYTYHVTTIDDEFINYKVAIKIPIYNADWSVVLYKNIPYLKFYNDDFKYIIGTINIESDADLYEIVNK